MTHWKEVIVAKTKGYHTQYIYRACRGQSLVDRAIKDLNDGMKKMLEHARHNPPPGLLEKLHQSPEYKALFNQTG